MFVATDNWFGFGFANSHYPDGCSSHAVCSGTVGDSGCVYPDTADVGCETSGVDAIIFGDYGGSLGVAVQEWTLNGWTSGSLHSAQDVSLVAPIHQHGNQYSMYSIRPYDPSDAPWYDLYSYGLPYPLGIDFYIFISN